ncbi:hypothetical protein Syun_002673 [Stephania yunnanensis]|uniref:KHDC4/BBP-like KH-domain type I domain-containing protein n=1 Tax=Stephania yunnanensis TaxID=152371 RepID=A0AAP0LFU9_9MAGN
MAAKVDKSTSVEPRAQTTIISSSSAASSSPKVSMFGAKSGFVIPKNKLSGSLVPVFRRGGKTDKPDAADEESNKQVQRKTKWGVDLTQDASIRRGRALAYQTRVEQITQLLKSGVLEKEDVSEPESVTESTSGKASSQKKDDQLEKQEMLELERREVIGEILKLNPSYKAPPDYKPLLKEAKVPVPLKLDSGKNFIGSVLRPGSNTQKRLEEETGAKISIHGTKKGMSKKDEIIVSDGNEAQISYDELYVHIVADTYEKVDAAVALIELLVTPVSADPVVSNPPTSVAADIIVASQETTSSFTAANTVANQGALPLIGGPMPLQILRQPYPGSWLPGGQPVGFIPPPHSSATLPVNQFYQAPFNFMNRPSFLAGQPASVAGFSVVPRSQPPLIPGTQPPLQGLQRPLMPNAPPSQAPPLRNNPAPGSQQLLYPTIPVQSNTIPPQVPGNQPITGPGQVPRLPLLSTPQSVVGAPLRPLTPAGSFTPVPQGPSMMQRPSPAVFPPRPNIAVPQPALASAMPATATTGPSVGTVSPAGYSTFGSVPSPIRPGLASPSFPATSVPLAAPRNLLATPSVPAQMLISASAFPQVPPAASSQASMPIPTSMASNQSLMLPSIGPQRPNLNVSLRPSQGPPPALPLAVLSASPHPQSGIQVPSASPSGTPTSVSGSFPGFTPVMPSTTTSPRSISPVTAPRPQRPNSGDFTFQPHAPQLPGPQTSSRPSNQPIHAPLMHSQPALRPPPPQGPSFQPPPNNSASRPGIPGFSSFQSPNMMAHSPVVISAPSLGSMVPQFNTSLSNQPPPRHGVFSNSNPTMPMPPVPRLGPQGFMQGPQIPNLPRAPPLHPENPRQMQPNQSMRPGNVLVPIQQYGNNPAFSSGNIGFGPRGNQVYDPFSPTTTSSAPQQGGNNSSIVRQQENDPEYDDLMASVGVK